jgi:methyl-accepting chemotaxis protein
MSEPSMTPGNESTQSSTTTMSLPVLGQRRKYLINRPYQLRITAIVVGIVFLFLLIVNLILFSLSLESSQYIVRIVPDLADFLQAQHEIQTTRLILGSVVLLVGVILVSIIETHKTAGAAFAIERGLRKIRKGRYDFRIQLRKSDNFKELEKSFNKLAGSLEDRTRADIDTLTKLANLAESDPGQVAARLRRLAEDKRRLLGKN